MPSEWWAPGMWFIGPVDIVNRYRLVSGDTRFHRRAIYWGFRRSPICLGIRGLHFVNQELFTRRGIF